MAYPTLRRLPVALALVLLLPACSDDAPNEPGTGGAGGSGTTSSSGVTSGSSSASGSSSTTGSSTTSSSTSSSTSSGLSEVCDPPLPAESPIGTETDFENAPAQGCFEEACLCSTAARPTIDKLLACDPVRFGFFADFGSLYVHTVARTETTCVFDVATEVEMSVDVHRCELPLPMAPWVGIETDGNLVRTDALLEGILDDCEFVANCCYDPECPAPCAEVLPDVPHCPFGFTSCGSDE